MLNSFIRVRDAYGRFLYFTGILSGVVLFVMMWLIDVNALSRKIFNAPLPAGVELTQSLLAVAIMLPFGYVLVKREHVNTVFLTSKMSPAVNRWLHFFWMMIGFFLFAAIAYGTYQFALRSYMMNEQVWGATIRFPLYPAKLAVSIGAALLCIQFLFDGMLALFDSDDGDLSNALLDFESVKNHV